MPTLDEHAFLAAIQEQPDCDGPRLIYADWLDDRGDPRGEFIRLQCALACLPADDPRRPDLDRRQQTLFDTHQQSWSACLQGTAADWTYRRGLVDAVSVDASAFLERGQDILRHGPIRRVRFLDASRCFAQLVASPLLSKVPEIDLCGNFLGNGGINVLARARHLNRLEVLHLGFNDLTDQGLRALAEIPHLSTLRELYLEDNRQFGAPGIRALAESPYLGNLRRLDLSGNSLTAPALKVLINAGSFPFLDLVSLPGNQIGDEGVESLARSTLLKRMLGRAPVLDLSRNNIGPVGTRALAESPLVESVETLDLALNAIGDAGLASLAQSPYLRNLKRLIIQENRVGDAGVLALASSRMPESLTFIDLTGNFITADSIRILDEATSAFDWRRKIEIKIDAGLHLRAASRAARP